MVGARQLRSSRTPLRSLPQSRDEERYPLRSSLAQAHGSVHMAPFPSQTGHPGRPLGPSAVLGMQRTQGNAHVQRLFAPSVTRRAGCGCGPTADEAAPVLARLRGPAQGVLRVATLHRCACGGVVVGGEECTHCQALRLAGERATGMTEAVPVGPMTTRTDTLRSIQRDGDEDEETPGEPITLDEVEVTGDPAEAGEPTTLDEVQIIGDPQGEGPVTLDPVEIIGDPTKAGAPITVDPIVITEDSDEERTITANPTVITGDAEGGGPTPACCQSERLREADKQADVKKADIDLEAAKDKTFTAAKVAGGVCAAGLFFPGPGTVGCVVAGGGFISITSDLKAAAEKLGVAADAHNAAKAALQQCEKDCAAPAAP